MPRKLRFPVAAAAVLVLAGCATVNIDDAVQETSRATPGFTNGKLELSRTDLQRQARERLSVELLDKPLSMDDAVQLALANSPSVQALIAQSWADMANANQAGRIGNPIFTFERVRVGQELEIGRLLSFGLLDLLTLPQRQVIARNQVAQAKTQLSANVVEQVSQVRQAWVRAVAARQLLAYAEQVNRSAQASAELARRMQQVGNFTRLQRARQHAFYADATSQLASARHAETAAREELVRQLGLATEQARGLKLPDRLPDLPKEPKAPADVSAAALQQRLDVQLAKLQLEAAGRSQGIALLNSLLDLEAGVRRDTVFDNREGTRQTARGFELEVRLPLFDWGGPQRAAMNAQSLLAANRYDAVVRSASSQLRESYSAYRTALDLARHYRDEVVPLRATISEENVLRYNGMLIGVFELLADNRDQIATVMAAIHAQQQFWLAEAALAAALIGKPIAMGATPVSTRTGSAGEDAH
ncbi:TolC family protein [Ramlibacter sp. WS9]|uniref:TolC family protein n=1 Tax=Ramlibacter sp. WS9 TaxID=1882741 RepID=UPI001144DC89|nr:TolC family protein [Ramlibacter sp. WS9]ROZ79586.1 TolC family protein [Ramlibacter sp. WS9]